MSRTCWHPETHIVATDSWNGSEYETYYHCGKCGTVLKKETVRLNNGSFKTQFVRQEDFKMVIE